MSQISENNKRIAKNTVLLYFRTLFIMAITLYTSRVILNALGVEDYGIYNVVGGVVAMFSLISGSLSNAISRFITFGGSRKSVGIYFSKSLIIPTFALWKRINWKFLRVSCCLQKYWIILR